MRATLAATAVLAALLPLGTGLAVPSEPPLAITGARIEPISGPVVEPGTVVIEKGKIVDVGPDDKVEVPPGADRIDGRGKTVLPGLVNPYTQVGLVATRVGGGINPHLSPVPGLAPRSTALRSALRAGFTTLAVTREGSGIPGTGVVIRTHGERLEDLVVRDLAYLRMTGGMGTSTIKSLRGALQGAQKEIEAREKYEKDLAAYKKAMEEAGKKAEEAKKKGEKAPEPPKLKEPKEPKANPRSETVRRAVKGEIPIFVRLDSATQLLHFEKVTEGFDKLVLTVLFEGSDGYRITDRLAKSKWSAILRPSLTTVAYTGIYRNVPAEFAGAGVPFALHAYPDNATGHADIYLALGRLVRAGLPRDRALRAVTLDAAVLLGLEKRLGSLDKGKDANLVVFSGDPLDVTTRIEKVILEGKVVHPAPEDQR